MQDKPQLWSTALMWLVAELFETLPEAGDLPKPKLVVLLRRGAPAVQRTPPTRSSDSIEQTVRLIRSKGVGVFFVTQTPKDVPARVLAQLGNRVQHALRAFTPDDAKALQGDASRPIPKSDFYDLEELLPALGIGEAAVTILDENGVPTPVVHTRTLAAALAHGAGRRHRRAREGVAAVREVRHARRRASRRARCSPSGWSRRPPPPRPRDEAAEPEHVPVPKDLPRKRKGTAPEAGGAVGDFLKSRQGQVAAAPGPARRLRDAAQAL